MVPARSLDRLGEEMKPETAASSQQDRVCGNHLGIISNVGFSCMNNCDDHTFNSETFSCHKKVEETEDLEVDVIDCADNTSGPVPTEDNPAVTEHSSSFDDTFSSSDDRFRRDSSDVEVESQFNGENGSTVSNGFHRLFGKKKLTPHWQKYIQPLKWRCKWLELQMKELHSQALKYEKELSVYNEEKSLQIKMVALNKSVARTVPLTCRNRSNYAMKRRRRKKFEDTVDMSSYMSCHNLFSYYEKGHEVDGLSVDESFPDRAENVRGHDDFGASYDWSTLDFRDDNNSLELILLEIEDLKSRVLKLKTQLGKGICLTPGFVPGGPHSSSPRSPSSSPGNNGDALPAAYQYTPPPCTSDYEIEDPVMPESAVTGYGDAAVPDIIGSTVGLLSLDRHQIGELGKDTVEDVLISNQAAELQNFDKVGHSPQKLQGVVKVEEEGEGSIPPRVLSSETGSETDKAAAPGQQPVLRRCLEPTTTYVRRSKRKRVERKVSPGGWHGERWRCRSSKKAKEKS